MRKFIKIVSMGLLIIGFLYVVIIFSGIGWSFYDSNSQKILQKRKLTKNIEEARERGVLIKKLKYKADSSLEKFDFYPYIEKAFRYGRDSTETLPAIKTNYPYRLGFQNKVNSLFIFIPELELNKFDSSAGSGLSGAFGYISKPILPDTILLGVRRDNEVIGTIKVWN